MEDPQQLCTLRGHSSSISCIFSFISPHTSEISLITADEKGWIVWWDIATKRPNGTWKGHSSRIVTMRQLKNGLLLTHSKDSHVKIWDITKSKSLSRGIPLSKYDDIDVNDETSKNSTASLLSEFPCPDFTTIPVNALNFCNVDSVKHFLVTPSTMNSENFDIYSIFEKTDPQLSLDSNLNLRRLVANFDGWSLYKKTVLKEEGVEEEIGSEDNLQKRDRLGIIMSLLFVSESILYVGYESGHVLAFEMERQSAISIDHNHVDNSKTLNGDHSNNKIKQSNRTVINKDMKMKIIYFSTSHVPNPIISLKKHNESVISGSTNNKLVLHNHITKAESEFSVTNSGIQSINVIDDKLIIGYWAGLIRGYVLSSKEKLFKICRKTPMVNSLESNIGNKDDDVQKNDKIRLTYVAVSTSATTGEPKSYKQMVQRKNKFTSKNLIYSGYGDGTISVHAI